MSEMILKISKRMKKFEQFPQSGTHLAVTGA